MSTDSAPKIPAEPGDVIADKYRVERVIGKGGMGLVVEAHHMTLPQRVAIKILLPEAAKQGDAVERFLREARAAVSIQSEHVARVMDLGTLASGLPYMVMELLTGADLQEIVRQRGPLPIAQAIDVVLQASEAIAEAHVLGIIHRDLKPANIFVGTRPDGSPLVKVLDFGLAKATRADALYTSLTAAHVIIGSPFYMSPEQIRGLKGLDARTDIWALGVILYQILTGKRPFEADATHALFLRIGGDPPAPPRWHRSEISAGLEAVVLQCLEKKPNDRPQSVADLARLLLPFASEEGRISVERIHRLQGVVPPERPPSIVEGTQKGAALEQAARQAFGEVSLSDDAMTLRQPAKAPPPEVPAAPPAPAPALAAPAAHVEEPNARNGATVVIPKVAPMPPAPLVEPPTSSSRGLVGVVVAAIVALVVIAAVLASRAW
ncbi:serine/threonine-protein kinase [Polyangium sp. 6x1]|uniref:serine/threonine-protein kinase n=1 Tax=Polyangium sp. 6x1 TaxID=3042689 RepID=UPI0024827B44|nr:serine/threonine-protein kinase [Polyangium sp. 6x1]MDI1448040.1 serine/threonine-protein kinase [Polyangium sp. 6x1]